MEKHPLHLKNPELQTSSEVSRAVEWQEDRTGEKVPNDPAERIEAYLKRLEKLVLDPNKEQKTKDLKDVLHTERPRALRMLRNMVLNEYVRPNKEKMAEAAAQVEERAARQMGIQAEYNEQVLEQRGEIAVGDLESSLDEWIKYLSNPNEPYPTWFRYYVFRNILNLGEYDKDKQEFPKRSKGTFKLFPDVDRGALAYVQEMMEASQDNAVLNRIREAQKTLWNTPEKDLLTKEKARAFANLSFAKQYAEGIKQNGEISPELRAETKGEWMRYKKGDDPKALWLSLQNKGTAWCTKGYPTAKTQLGGGDFYVYYTLDTTGSPTIPRIAIRMEGDKKIAENPRGVFDSQQNLEPNMVEIMEEKLKEFGQEADKFKKKSADMKILTALEKKREKAEAFTKENLVLLYEINGTIKGFGYQKDPRVAELRQGRNVDEDMLVIFECEREQIAHVPSQINENTKAYVGPICKTAINPETRKEEVAPEYKDFFQKLPENLEHIYSMSFPEGRIQKYQIEIGGKTKDDLKAELTEKKIYVSDWANQLLDSKDFTVLESTETYDLVRLTVKDLGFPNGATTDEIYRRALDLGLDLCPAEVGPNLRLSNSGDDWMYIAMKQIADRDGYPGVFDLGRGGDALGLHVGGARPTRGWGSGNQFVFSLRKKKL